MTDDTVLKIRNTENECRENLEREIREGSDALRLARAECEVRLAREREECRRRFDEGCVAANAEGERIYDQAENDSFDEAKSFVLSYGSRLPDAVRFIVEGIVGKWQ